MLPDELAGDEDRRVDLRSPPRRRRGAEHVTARGKWQGQLQHLQRTQIISLQIMEPCCCRFLRGFAGRSSTSAWLSGCCLVNLVKRGLCVVVLPSSFFIFVLGLWGPPPAVCCALCAWPCARGVQSVSVSAIFENLN